MSWKKPSDRIATTPRGNDLDQSTRQQMYRLRRDNHRLRQECEILKKAAD